jgi:hypothetical protein
MKQDATIRMVVKTLLEDKSLGPAMVKVNPVIDQSAALTDPSNVDFKPASKPELQAAMSTMMANVPDEKIPDIYDTIKHAMTVAADESNEDEKMNNKIVEEAIRHQIRKIIQEALPTLPRPKLPTPSNPLGPVDPDIIDTKGMSAYEKKVALSKAKHAKPADVQAYLKKAEEEWKAAGKEIPPGTIPGITKGAPGVGSKVAQKPTEKQLSDLRAELEASMLGSAEEKEVGGKKNLMGDEKLRQLAVEFGYKNPNGVAQFIDRVLQDKVKQRLNNPEAYEIATLEAMEAYINKLLELDLIEPQDASLMKQHPEFVGNVSMTGEEENPEDEGSFFRTKFLAPRLKKLDKMFKASGT